MASVISSHMAHMELQGQAHPGTVIFGISRLFNSSVSKEYLDRGLRKAIAFSFSFYFCEGIP